MKTFFGYSAVPVSSPDVQNDFTKIIELVNVELLLHYTSNDWNVSHSNTATTCSLHYVCDNLNCKHILLSVAVDAKLKKSESLKFDCTHDTMVVINIIVDTTIIEALGAYCAALTLALKPCLR